MKLTKDNYFTKDNKYISNSKIKDWLKDKEFFYKKHIEKSIKEDISDALVIGSAVDMWLTESKEKFEDTYLVVSRRNKKSDTPWRYQLPNSMYDKVVNLCERVEKTDAYKEIVEDKYVSQEILQLDLDLGYFSGVCGIPDWYSTQDDVIYIIDLKTSKTIDPTRYHYHCIDFGYYTQQAIYQILLGKKYNKDKFSSKHLVVEKDPDNINQVEIFQLNQDRIDAEKERVYEILEELKNEKDFAPKQATLKEPIEIGDYGII